MQACVHLKHYHKTHNFSMLFFCKIITFAFNFWSTYLNVYVCMYSYSSISSSKKTCMNTIVYKYDAIKQCVLVLVTTKICINILIFTQGKHWCMYVCKSSRESGDIIHTHMYVCIYVYCIARFKINTSRFEFCVSTMLKVLML